MHEAFRIQAGDRDLYLIAGRLYPAIAGGDFLTGSTKTSGSESISRQYMYPHQDVLTAIMGGGLPSVAKGYLENVAVPTTMNSATAMGLGRSGGALEAVANTAWQPGYELMKLLLGLPPVETSSEREFERKQKESKGPLDWIGALMDLTGTGLDIYNKWPSSKGSTTSPIQTVLDAAPSWMADIFGGAGGT